MRHRLLFTISILAFLSFPSQALAATIDARDTVAGLSTEVLLRSFPPSSTIPVRIADDMGNGLTIEATTDSAGAANVRIRGQELERAGEYSADVPAAHNARPARFTVLPETLDPLLATMSTERRTIVADGRDAISVRVRMVDHYGNPLADRPVALIASRPQDRVLPVKRETDKNGVQEFTVQTTEEGDMLLRAMDLLSSTTIESVLAVTALPPGTETAQKQYRTLAAQIGEEFESVVVGFEVTVDPPVLQVEREAQKVTVRAFDRQGRTVKSYLGNIIFTTTDPEATVPVMQRPNYGEYQFEERDQGIRPFTLALRFPNPGEHTLTVTASENPSVRGEANVTVIGGAGPRKHAIDITSHKDGQFINSTTVTLEGNGPPLINIVAIGGREDVTGETAADGTFHIPVQLDPSRREFTLRVQQKPGEGSADSGPIVLLLDTTPPDIASITFSPEKPNPHASALTIVLAEPRLKNLAMHLTETPGGVPVAIPLEETATAGTYQALFTTPNSGNYQPLFHAEDEAGNSTELRSALTVVPKPLAKVENVRGEAKGTAAVLEWDPVPDEVDGYRLYVGEDAINALYSLDTGRPVTRATVSGLLPGKTYYFSLTAVKGEQESAEKSTPAKVAIIGLTLKVTEEDGGLSLEWPSLPDSLPLASFVLEYGTTPNTFTERRTLNGALRSFTLRDLLNDVTYNLRLTPVNITGELLSDLTALGTGTPRGAGFRPGPSEPIPMRPEAPQPPRTSDTGFPPGIGWFAIVLATGGAIVYVQRRRNARRTLAFLQAVHAQYRTV